jgi:hypothetical protein
MGLGVAALLILAGGGGWMAAHGGAHAETPAAPVAKQATMVTAMPAASAPGELDLSTPEKAMAAFSEALKSGDRERTYRTLLADPQRITAIRAMLDTNLAGNRLVIEARKKFGAQVNGGTFGMMTIDRVADAISGTGDGLKKSVDGESAELSMHVSEEAKAMLPKGEQMMVQMWSDAPVRLKKVGTEWRFDIDRTMRVEVQGRKANFDAAKVAAAFEDGAKITDEITAGIRDETITTLAEVRMAFQAGMKRMARDHQMNGVQVMIVPADYAEVP